MPWSTAAKLILGTCGTWYCKVGDMKKHASSGFRWRLLSTWANWSWLDVHFGASNSCKEKRVRLLSEHNLQLFLTKTICTLDVLTRTWSAQCAMLNWEQWPIYQSGNPLPQPHPCTGICESYAITSGTRVTLRTQLRLTSITMLWKYAVTSKSLLLHDMKINRSKSLQLIK